MLSSLYSFFKFIFYVFFRIFYRLEVIGQENIPKEGGVIIASNHVSYLDPPVLGVSINRKTTFMAREGLFKIPILNIFVKSFSFPVRRGKTQPSTIKEAVRRLNNGELIVIFPEGGRSPDGKLMEPKRGIGVIAGISRATIVPAFISGTEKALPVGAKFLHPARIKVIFGKPIKVKEHPQDKETQEKICKNITDAIKELKIETTSRSKVKK